MTCWVGRHEGCLTWPGMVKEVFLKEALPGEKMEVQLEERTPQVPGNSFLSQAVILPRLTLNSWAHAILLPQPLECRDCAGTTTSG